MSNARLAPLGASHATRQHDTTHAHDDDCGCGHDHHHYHGHGHHHGAPGVTIVRDGPKIGRNDPCLCGSGKKYKKCCLDRA